MLTCAAQSGYDVEGIELSPSAAVIADQLKIAVHQKTLADAAADLRFTEYGVISYFHVLEHVYDPQKELTIARDHLADDGILVVEVPFFDSFFWRVFGGRHRHCYRGHRSYFNQASLRLALERSGFRPIVIESVPYAMTLDWVLMRIGPWTMPARRVLTDALRQRIVRVDTGEYLLALSKKA